jgi:hypothetical protein
MSTRTAVLDRMLDPVFTPELARQLADFRADPQTQAHIEELAEKCNEGLLTPDEREEYEAYVSAINFVSILQAKARRILKQSAA